MNKTSEEDSSEQVKTTSAMEKKPLMMLRLTLLKRLSFTTEMKSGQKKR